MNPWRWIPRVSILLCLLVVFSDPVDAVELGSGGIQITEQSPTAQVGGSLQFTLQLPGVVADDDQIIVTVHEPVVDEAEFRQ